LKVESTTFERVLDDLRHRLALNYLDSAKKSVNQTAYLVGFSDPAAFSRAFKRWTGKNPRHIGETCASRGRLQQRSGAEFPITE
jgi:AraC-type DNA-binding domain-containing proteins